MRVAIVGVPYPTGGGVVTQALYKFLQSTPHQARLFQDYYAGPHTRRQQFVRKRLGWRLGMKYRQRVIEREFAALVEGVKAFQPQVVIAVEQGEILLQDVGGARKLFYANAPTAHETYFQNAAQPGPFDWTAYEMACRKEIEYYQAADAVIFCWNTHVNYVRQHVYQGNNLVLHPGLGWYGCEPQAQRALFGFPPFLVYMGATAAYWNNAELLTRLAGSIPYALHVYGPKAPLAQTNLNYQGFSDSTDVLARYQFGVHTATREELRRYGFASKITTYLGYGLPVLSPEWQIMSGQLRGVIPFNETNFVTQLEAHLDPDVWQARADEAYAQANEIEWSRVLKPLLELF